MTTKETVEILNMVEAHGYLVMKAKRKAVLSLEAWGEVMQTLESLIVSETCQDIKKVGTNEPYISLKGQCYQEVLRMIKSNLEELENE